MLITVVLNRSIK